METRNLSIPFFILLMALSAQAEPERLPAAAAIAVGSDTPMHCPQYKVFYIDPASQFFTPPVPIEDHAEYVFCSDHTNLDEIRLKLKKMRPIRSSADLDAGRIKVVPRGKPSEAITFCSTGEITYKGKQYRLDRKVFEPSLLSLRAEGDRQRELATEAENKGREPAAAVSSGKEE